MLKNIPNQISPELMKALMEMGHGDEILLADGNFPAHSYGKKVIRADGLGIPEIMEAILKFLPLDTFVDFNVIFMDNGSDEKPKIWKKYIEILENSGEKYSYTSVERFQFYKKCENVFAIVATSETALYANVILKKGVVK
ncbi:MAG: fucose isomerase [Candidatus Cloacimonetes bacterium]|nr:fucose isomerase [Candidatus Cloacimonadota bacterium]